MQKLAYVILVDEELFLAVDSSNEELKTSLWIKKAKFFSSTHDAQDEVSSYKFRQNQIGMHNCRMHKFEVKTVALLAL